MNITLQNLCKSYGDKQVLKNFCATIPEGKTTVLMGSSGVGKTTIANILLGFESPDSGTCEGVPDKKSAVFQDDLLSENFTVLANTAAALRTKDAKKKARSILCGLGLKQEIRNRVGALSGGMKRRVALARALTADYDFLVLDEPFKGLDSATKMNVMQFTKEATAQKTVLLITHDAQEAAYFADHTITIENREDCNHG